MAARVFLIGATGNIGKALMAELAADQRAGRLEIGVGVRSEQAAATVESRGFQPVSFDFEHRAGFDTALAGADTIFLLRPYTIRQMMYGKQVIDAAVRAGAKAIITVGAYGSPDTAWPVIGWNFLVEAYAERSGLAWTHLRPNFFMDNILAQRDPASGTIFNGLGRIVSWIASEDIAAVAAAVLRQPERHAGRAYGLASVAASPDEIAGYLSAATGQPHRIVPPVRAIVMERLLAQGREPFYADALLEYVAAIAADEVGEAADVFDTVEQVAGRPALTWPVFLEQRLGRKA